MDEPGPRAPAVFGLRRLLAPARPARPAARASASCELCDEALPDAHAHAVALEPRALACVCRACYLLFTHPGAAGGRYRAVPERYAFARDLPLGAEQWEALQIPVGIAFFFVHSGLGRAVAFYPGPAGAIESPFPLEVWDELVRASPALAGLEPDVEALLARRHDAGCECYLVPIDACYELTGRIRRRWKGFDGGQAARLEIEDFFGRLRERTGAGRGGPWAN